MKLKKFRKLFLILLLLLVFYIPVQADNCGNPRITSFDLDISAITIPADMHFYIQNAVIDRDDGFYISLLKTEPLMVKAKKAKIKLVGLRGILYKNDTAGNPEKVGEAIIRKAQKGIIVESNYFEYNRDKWPDKFPVNLAIGTADQTVGIQILGFFSPLKAATY